MTRAIRQCSESDIPAILEIINDAAQAYRGVIPADCWHEPYMTRPALERDTARGLKFWGWEDSGRLIGVMGLQKVADATIVRHAYVRTADQGKGIGGALMQELRNQVFGLLLVGTWADAEWAIGFYQRHGFRLVPEDEKESLLRVYWSIPPRQAEVSVVLRLTGALEGATGMR